MAFNQELQQAVLGADFQEFIMMPVGATSFSHAMQMASECHMALFEIVVGKYGNCIAASIPMALALAERDGRLRRGQTVMVLGTGAGLHIAGMILRW